MDSWHGAVVEIPEWNTIERSGLPPLTEADRALAEALADGEGRLVVEELRDAIRIETKAWIGVVRFSGFEIRVVPKVAGGELGVLQMLSYTRGLDALKRLTNMRALDVPGGHLLDLIALLLASAAIDIMRGGLLADYVTREESLPMVRGRLLVREQVVRRFGQVDRVECRFDEFESDIDENRLVAAALQAVSYFSRNDEVRRLVHRARASFDEACDASALDPTWIDEPIAYHRRNDHYQDAHTFARLVLQQLAVRDIYAPGSARSFAFLIDMNRLFEDFVTALLQRRLTPLGFSVRSQARDRSLLVYAATNQPDQSIRPDVLVEWQQPDGSIGRLPIDAKYKVLDDRRASSSDLYQAFIYSYAYASVYEGKAVLMYPSNAASRTDVRVRGDAEVWSSRISIVGLPLVQILAAMGKGEELALPIVDEIIMLRGPVSSAA